MSKKDQIAEETCGNCVWFTKHSQSDHDAEGFCDATGEIVFKKSLQCAARRSQRIAERKLEKLKGVLSELSTKWLVHVEDRKASGTNLKYQTAFNLGYQTALRYTGLRLASILKENNNED